MIYGIKIKPKEQDYMLNKKLKATSPGLRHQISIEKNVLCKNNNFLKKNIITIKKRGGRSRQDGHITSWHRGGGNKKKSILIGKLKPNTFSICIAIVYNATRNSFIAILFNFETLQFNFVIHTDKQCVGSLIESGLNNKIISQRYGSVLQLKDIYTGAIVNSVFIYNKNVYAKSAGTYCQIIQKYKDSIKLRLPSGKIVNSNINTLATLGSVSNKNYSLCILGKAGKKRYNKKRPIVRGVAMNPVDHPHGGRTNGGRPSVSPWGKLTKGVPTKKIK
jgi:large subunit ribosomal protein L2